MTLRCPACGARYEGEARFCTRDGSRLLPADAATAAAVDPLLGQLLSGRYRVQRRVGEGGMAVVYRAEDEQSGEALALKVLAPVLTGDATAMARLRREAEMGRLLRHPNVCPILAMARGPGAQVYVVMPFLEGETLTERLVRRGPLPAAEVAGLVADVAEGLQAAHAMGIVHRDLKPENVMVCTRRDPGGAERAVVMDFGLATDRRSRLQSRRLTRTGMVMGTPEFMSPEQLRDQPLDARSDVYALALVTCELLTGRLPFPGSSQQEQMLARLRVPPLPLRELRAELQVPPAVELVMRRGLAVDREQRYPTAPAFAQALVAALGGRAAVRP
ncbi:MAG TPA: serine/threonine-protein kinase [Gemmatimonadaceae bacterium]|nr:serine/threonine-protein kinase [Gemmatimonadaceae bacterium]